MKAKIIRARDRGSIWFFQRIHVITGHLNGQVNIWGSPPVLLVDQGNEQDSLPTRLSGLF